MRAGRGVLSSTTAVRQPLSSWPWKSSRECRRTWRRWWRRHARRRRRSWALCSRCVLSLRARAPSPCADPRVTPDRTHLNGQDLAREVKLRKEAEAVLAETTRVRGGYLSAARGLPRPPCDPRRTRWQAYSALREQQARVLDEQGELQATVSQMRDELKAKDAELAKLKPDHRPSLWAEPKLVRPTRAACALGCWYGRGTNACRLSVPYLPRSPTLGAPPTRASSTSWQRRTPSWTRRWQSSRSCRRRCRASLGQQHRPACAPPAAPELLPPQMRRLHLPLRHSPASMPRMPTR